MNLASYGTTTGGWYLSCGEHRHIARTKQALKTYANKHNITLYWRRDV